ncbi:MAG: hypothetical protein IJZ84_05745 [Lachnospiraceae bacterium]|nr:hypothetical protein [Lachnospiraceae bacterium]
MFEKLDLMDKINKELKGRGKTYIGYDLGAGYGEISVFTEQDLNPVTLLSRKDATVFHFPCMLVKHRGRFYAGFEAQGLAEEEGALVFEDLLELAMKQPTVVAGGQRFETEYLLGLFLKLSLQLPEDYGKVEKAGGILFTTYIDEDPALQNRVYEVLAKAAGQIFGKRTRLYLQTRSESIFYFLMHQEESLYREDTLICDYQQDYLKSYVLQKHGIRAPFAVTVTRTDYPDMQLMPPRAEEISVATREEHLDETFRQVIMDIESKYDFGLAYVIGDGFKGNWMDQSLIRLCEHGRVFQGNNLYSLGACYCLRQMITPSPVLEEYIYYSKQDIHFDIGLYCRSQGTAGSSVRLEYMEIFEQGSSYEACKRTIYLLPEGEDKLIIEARSITETTPRRLGIDLKVFPQRRAGLSKLKVTLEFTDYCTLQVTVEDIGLGEVVSGSGKVLRETFDLKEQ